MTQEINLTINVDGSDYDIKGFPKELWRDFMKRAEAHFPNSKDAWASYISEAIVAAVGGNSRTYFLTDVPEDVARSMDKVLARVGWTWDQFHSYLLRAAFSNLVRMVSFREKDGEDQQFGTLIVTGIRPQAFTKVDEVTQDPNVTFEAMIATFMEAVTEGNIRFTPKGGVPYVRPMD